MTADEFQSWLQFFAIYPFDDLSRYHRPAALVSASMSGGSDAFAERLSILSPDPATSDLSDVDQSILKAVGG